MPFEQLAWGYRLPEAPRVDAQGGLYFADTWGGGVYRRAPDGEIATVIPDRLHVGGIALHAEGGIVVSGEDVRHVDDGTVRVLFELPGIIAFNDLFVDADGQVLTGSVRSSLKAPPDPWVAGEAYRIRGITQAVELYNDVTLSNGIGFAPDGATLYHCDTMRRHIIAHDVDPKGHVTNRRAFVEIDRGYPDGMVVDAEGGLWVASFGGGCVLRFAADGTRLDPLEVPASSVTSLCFGGDDLQDLYITARDNTEHPDRRGTIFRTRTDVPGLPPPKANV